MKSPSVRRRPALIFSAILALIAGIFLPAFESPTPAHAAFGAMIQPVNGTVTGILSNRCVSTDSAHIGIDIVRNDGQPIIAAYGGTVTQSGTYFGYGYAVTIQHPGGYKTLYAHMRSAPPVAVGATVTQGQVIGYVGSTGNTTAPHLHWEVWRDGVNLGAQLGYSCNQQVTRGAAIPYAFPGLGSGTVVDFNSDGKSDLLAVTDTGALMTFPGDGAGKLGTGVQTGSGWQGMPHLTRGDFNNDGHGDIIGIRADGTLYFHAGTGSLRFRAGVLAGRGWQTISKVELGADFTGDNLQDVVAVTADGQMRVYAGNGRGGFAGGYTSIGWGWGSAKSITVGDFNSDGRTDIMAVFSDGNLRFYGGTSTPFRFSPSTVIGGGWGSMTAFSGGVDYTGNGTADLIARTDTGDVRLYAGSGRLTFSSSVIATGWASHLRIE